MGGNMEMPREKASRALAPRTGSFARAKAAEAAMVMARTVVSEETTKLRSKTLPNGRVSKTRT
jgi:hypothetical protein